MSALTEALVAAQAELPTAIPCDSQVAGYRYTSLDKLIEATRPILNKHGLAITQWPSFEVAWVDNKPSTRPMLVTRIDHANIDAGRYEHLEYKMPLYVTEQTSPGHGAAITYARRYAWAAALGIASEEDTDGTTTLTDPDDVPF